MKEIKTNNRMDFIDKNLQSYVESHSDSETELLEEINRYTNLNVLNPRMLSGHLQGRILSFISRMINPKTILEAMSIGCIVIASDIKNHRELIEHKKNGILFDLNSMNIVEIIDEIEIDLKLQNKLSSNAINSVIKNNHIDKLSKNMYEDYKLLLR